MKRIICIVLTLIMMLSAAVFTAHGKENRVSFSDVKESRWSYREISYAVEKGYMNGIGDGKFGPTGTTTRGMVVTVLYRLAGSPDMSLYKTKFKDVKDNAWYYDAVKWGQKEKIVSGIDNETFSPNGAITREQLAALIYRYAQYDYVIRTGSADISSYSDFKKVSSYAKDAMSWCNAEGIISGMTETTLAPKGNATREQFAAILYRYDNAPFDYEVVYKEPTLHSYYTEKEYPLVNNADIYVSPDGSDSADGSFEHPIRTFEKAKEMVRGLKETKKEGDIIVAFRAGNYGHLDDIMFGAEDSGTEEREIIYCRYGDGEVIFSNGLSFTSEMMSPIDQSDAYLFKGEVDKNIYKYTFDDDTGVKEELVRGAIPILACSDGITTPARYPNLIGDRDDYMRGFIVESEELDNTHFKAFTVLARRLDTAHDISEVYFQGYLKYEWYSDCLSLVGYDKETKIVETAPGYYADAPFDPKVTKAFLFNMSEELDRNGEFYYNSKTKTIYVYNPSGTYSLVNGGSFMHMYGSHITLDGFTFLGGNGTAVAGIYNMCGLNISGSNNTLKNCTVNGTYTGIGVTGSGHLIYGNTVEYTAERGIEVYAGDSATLTGCGIVLDNNLIHDTGRIEQGAAAIHLACVGATVSHNEVYNTPHKAVTYGGNNNIIEYNYFHNCCRDAADMGIFYNGRTVLSGGNKIRYNLFGSASDNPNSWAIYLDDGLAYQEIYGNMFFSCGVYSVLIAGGRGNKFYDNVSNLTTWTSAKYYEAAYRNDEPLGSYEGLADSVTRESYVNSEIWKEAFPEITKIITDRFDITDPLCLCNPTGSEIYNNYYFGNGRARKWDDDNPEIDGYKVWCDRFEEIVTLNETPENRFFENPAKGDYRIRADVENAPYVPIEKMGRY